ncbi:MAG: hypothetical protein ACR2KK_01190 [Acidimicrobiales bacterium]
MTKNDDLVPPDDDRSGNGREVGRIYRWPVEGATSWHPAAHTPVRPRRLP